MFPNNQFKVVCKVKKAGFTTREEKIKPENKNTYTKLRTPLLPS